MGKHSCGSNSSLNHLAWAHELPGWVIVDPHFHWAISSYQQTLSDGSKTFTRIEYQDIPNIAFPKKISQDELNEAGETTGGTLVLTFERPKPCEYSDKNYKLPQFALEEPK